MLTVGRAGGQYHWVAGESFRLALYVMFADTAFLTVSEYFDSIVEFC